MFVTILIITIYRWRGGRNIKLEGSDHVPVHVILRDIPDLPLHNTPSLAVRYIPEVRGWQQSIGVHTISVDLALKSLKLLPFLFDELTWIENLMQESSLVLNFVFFIYHGALSLLILFTEL